MKKRERFGHGKGKGRESKSKPAMDISLLPTECISSILAFTSPKDACRSAAVSAAFKSAADSDALWKSFLPSDYQDIISQSSSSSLLNSLSKKDLYFHLCDHSVLIGSGNTSFVLEKWSGRKCYMIGARDLDILWVNSPEVWTWKSLPESRFPEVPELKFLWWFDIKGKIETKKLTRETNYAVYFVFKLAEEMIYRHGFRQKPVLLRVYFEGAEVEEGKMVMLDPPEGSLRLSEDRPDGWMEIEMGEIYNELGDDGSIIFSLKEVRNRITACRLIVEGIEIRPKDS